ncbi:MAG TPA: TadE family protein [Verrucomicrobiae bacterium]|nr:TadE family protein [Verrucomicrobiae bacterium]
MKRAQGGMAAIEFAVIGGMAITTLFASIEIGRLFYAYNAVAEATRRGAYAAATTGSAAEAQAKAVEKATFLKGLTPAKVKVEYFDLAGAPAPVASAAFVTVSITGYTHFLLIPGLNLFKVMPPFATTLPAESLGQDPDA